MALEDDAMNDERRPPDDGEDEPAVPTMGTGQPMVRAELHQCLDSWLDAHGSKVGRFIIERTVHNVTNAEHTHEGGRMFRLLLERQIEHAPIEKKPEPSRVTPVKLGLVGPSGAPL